VLLNGVRGVEVINHSLFDGVAGTKKNIESGEQVLLKM
jgi:hypothetical protein